jgi:hypothetical protein
LIPIDGNYICSDYEESNNLHVQSKISYCVLKSLNCDATKEYINVPYEKGEIMNCFPRCTSVKIYEKNQKKSYSFKKINTIQIGDYLDLHNRVIGKYRCMANENQWFYVKDSKTNKKIALSPRVIIKHEVLTKNKWNKVYNIEDYTDKISIEFEVFPKSKKCVGYHLITEKHEFEIENNIKVRDFIETDDPRVQSDIEKIILE